MKTIEKKVSFNAPGHTVKEVKRVVTFRAKPSEVEYWTKEAEKLGVKDFSAFIRGALHSAISVSQRAKDSDWQKFVEAAQPLAKKILGFGFYDGGAKDIESRGTELKGIPADEAIARIRKKYNIK
jgi:hypothetical protein